MHLDRNRSSVYRLKYKLFMKINRVEYITENDVDMIKDISREVCERCNVICENVELDGRLVSLEIKTKPNIDLSKFVNSYKSASSKRINNKIKNESGALKESFWEKGYMLITLGDEEKKFLNEYIGL